MLDAFGFGSLGNAALNTALHGQPVSTHMVTDFRSDIELLQSWGEIHRREFRWQSSWGDWHMVLSGKHPTAEAADAEAREMAIRSGYRAPSQWEFWRWNEAPLPAATQLKQDHEAPSAETANSGGTS